MPLDLAQDPKVYQVTVTLLIVTALFVLKDRQLLMVPLLIQYVLVASLLSQQIQSPVFVIRVMLGLAISAIGLITARRTERTMARVRQASVSEIGSPPPHSEGMSTTFRILTLSLAVLLAFGLWNSYRLPLPSAGLMLASYWLAFVGLGLVLVNTEPLQIGLGLLVFVSGFAAAYLVYQPSLLVIALFGMVEISLALAVIYLGEAWLDLFAREAERA